MAVESSHFQFSITFDDLKIIENMFFMDVLAIFLQYIALGGNTKSLTVGLRGATKLTKNTENQGLPL